MESKIRAESSKHLVLFSHKQKTPKCGVSAVFISYFYACKSGKNKWRRLNLCFVFLFSLKELYLKELNR